MRKLPLLPSILLAIVGAHARAAAPASAPPLAATAPPAALPAELQRTLEQLRTAGLQDDFGYATVSDLVTQIGPRRAGSAEEARARDWAVGMLRNAGFSTVHIEPFTFPSWEPQLQSAAVTSPVRQPLVVAALGGSPSTPDGGIDAEVVRVASLDALARLPANAVRGRIVFVDEPMARTQDGSGYGAAVRKRSRCAPEAQALGAVACLIRAVGTNSDRFTHQGGNSRQADGAHLPAAALAAPDADTLARLVARGGPVRVRLEIRAAMQDAAPSGNVIAEVRGRERPEQIVLAAAHLDSWTLGQGAVDDGAGIAIITAAARLIARLPQPPRRTIRLLLAGSEEPGGAEGPGGFGGLAYGDAHARDQHVIAAESDTGADLVWRVRTHFGAGALPYARVLQGQLAPLAILPGDNDAGGGSDIRPVVAAGTPVIALGQDASHYFDVHHTANDTLAQVDPANLRQNIAAWAVALYLAAESGWDFRAP